eukprot:5328424-Amphidinium_carterae.1
MAKEDSVAATPQYKTYLGTPKDKAKLFSQSPSCGGNRACGGTLSSRPTSPSVMRPDTRNS